MLHKATSDPTVSKMAEVVDRQSKQVARFVADLLDASRLRRASQGPCYVRDADLGSVMDTALDPLEPRCCQAANPCARIPLNAPSSSDAIRRRWRKPSATSCAMPAPTV